MPPIITTLQHQTRVSYDSTIPLSRERVGGDMCDVIQFNTSHHQPLPMYAITLRCDGGGVWYCLRLVGRRRRGRRRRRGGRGRGRGRGWCRGGGGGHGSRDLHGTLGRGLLRRCPSQEPLPGANTTQQAMFTASSRGERSLDVHTWCVLQSSGENANCCTWTGCTQLHFELSSS